MKDQTNILIVDDDTSFRRSMSLILAREGYSVQTAKDGPEALAKATETAFRTIFMDIKMPVMNGVEAYKKIKNIRPEAEIVMMTAYSVEELIQEAIQEGAFAVIYKPVDIEKVIALIGGVTARSGRVTAMGGGVTARGQRVSILLVDDDPVFCDGLKDMLAIDDYDVDIALTGEEAVSASRRRPYDVVCIDCRLPNMNGLETYIAIKEIRPHTTAIMMTGYREEMAELVEHAIASCAYSCLYKPFETRELLKLIDEIGSRTNAAKRPQE